MRRRARAAALALVACLALACPNGEPEPLPAPPDASPPAAEPTQPIAEPTLSLEELGRRIQQARAIGVFTKLALKDDIDDLLAAMSAHHERGEGNLALLRERFEALVLKLTTLLERDEPELALALARARDDLWGRLSDPVAFAELTT